MSIRSRIIFALMAAALGVLFIPGQAPALTASHTDCSFCHGLHGGSQSQLLNEASAEALCLSCHGPAGTSSLKADIHVNKTGSSYGAFSITCTTCHSSHSWRYNWQDGLNVNSVGRDAGDWPALGTNAVINTPSSGIANVVFESHGTDVGESFYNSFADNDQDGDGVYDGVCEVCHTETLFHQNTSASDHTHNTGTTCITCHAHDETFSKAAGTCVECHKKQVGSPPDVFRQVTGSGGDFQLYTSRHTFGGTVSDWDCIVCHAEGDLTSTNASILRTGEHNDTYKTIALRNVDSSANPGSAGDDYWLWPKPSGVLNDTDYSNMDTFCMGCHDSDSSRGAGLGGASGVAVKDTANGVTTSPTLNERTKPFNPTDALDLGGTAAGSVTVSGYPRTAVADIYGRFDPANPSHHAVRAQRYTTKNGTDYFCNATLDKAADTQGECEGLSPPGAWDTTLQGGPYCILDAATYPDQSTCEAFGSGRDSQWIFVGWGQGAWVSHALKNGTDIQVERETVTLHCADCHSVSNNAHGGANGFMLSASSIDASCWLCHNSSVVYSASASYTAGSRHDHTIDSSRTMDPAQGSKLGQYGTNGGSACLLCHGGAHYDGYGAIHGIPSGSDGRVAGQERYRFIGGSSMSKQIVGGDWSSAGVATNCYFIAPDPQPWSNCAHHSAPTSGPATSYTRGTSY